MPLDAFSYNGKVTKISYATIREVIERERIRLKNPDPEWLHIYNKSGMMYPFPWMLNLFGKRLDDPVEDIADKDAYDIHCQLCGKKLGLDDVFVKVEFSFCDEYDCGIIICHECPIINM